MINAWWEPLDFSIPDSLRDLSWQVELDTAAPNDAERIIDPSSPVTLTGRSLQLLRSPRSDRQADLQAN
jgi:hypothetical protein